jgi:epoxyqueuosine reductase
MRCGQKEKMLNSDIQKNTSLVKSTALELGFSFCGISKAEFLEDEAKGLESWLNKGYQGSMSYMNNYFDKRLDPRLLVPGAKSVVSLLYNYYPSADLATDDAFKISKYAYGEDYHLVIKDKLKELVARLTEIIGHIEGRVFVDSAPVMERAWAKRSGIGWIGKNSLLINKQQGSFFFIAELIIDLELVSDGPIRDYCGTCTACMDACPTDAIPEPFVVDANRCISYLTIELKEEIPAHLEGKMGNWIFGCDICQDVCPWNRFSKPHSQERFIPDQTLASFSKADWKDLSEEVFGKLFGRSPLKRTRFAGLKRNIRFVSAGAERKDTGNEKSPG